MPLGYRRETFLGKAVMVQSKHPQCLRFCGQPYESVYDYLSKSSALRNSTDGGTRTHDHIFVRDTLSQLSYVGITESLIFYPLYLGVL